jgi:Bardet-Biedl syndrome 9 protein
MSIFKAREWFAAQVGTNQEEEFCASCLCVANIDANVDNYENIVIGGLSGSLTIFGPSRDKADDAETNASPDETVLETVLDAPILKIAAGRFSSTNDRLCIAVLHPRKLTVFLVIPAEGNVAYGKQYALNRIYSHPLERSAFSFSHGPFGGVKSKDFLCVLSLDGTLTVFEQETPAFSRFLPNFLLPGLFLYVESIDAFVVASSEFTIECYKYKSLAVPTSYSNPEELTQKPIAPDWAFSFGENILDIQVVRFEARTILVILCDRSLYALEDFGVIRFAKALEYAPLALASFATDYEDWVRILVRSLIGLIK